MARNPVQFQKGISLNEFLSLYGTEEQCFDALYRWRWPNGFVCPNCGHDRGCQLTTHKLQQCYRCNRQTSITAGTIFEATKLPLTVWLQGIYFMTQDKKGVSAMKLHRQLGISYNAAWRMRHKLMQVMMERDREHPLGGFVQLDDAYLGGERSGGKRGRGAPGKTPFVAAVETNAEGHPLRVKLTVVEGFRLTEIAAWAQQHLNSGTQVLSDGLACFNGVTAAGCVHEPMVDRRRESRGRASRVSMGEHDSRQHQERLVRHLPCGSPQVCAAISGGVRVPVQSALRPARHHPQTGLRGAANPADAGTAAQVTLGLSGNQAGICSIEPIARRSIASCPSPTRTRTRTQPRPRTESRLDRLQHGGLDRARTRGTTDDVRNRAGNFDCVRMATGTGLALRGTSPHGMRPMRWRAVLPRVASGDDYVRRRGRAGAVRTR